MSEHEDSFLSRWSRRKAQVRQGVAPPPAGSAVVVPFPAPEAVPAPTPPAQNAAVASAAAAVAPTPSAAAVDATAGPTPPAAQPPVPGQAQSPPKPTLEDVETLTPESDFSRFIARDVDENVKNSAMKKLFSDPHYNVMDGLDTYIDDYNTPDPLPKSMLRQLVQARMLGLLDDELPEQPAAEAAAQAAAAAEPAPVADETTAPAAEPAAVEDGGVTAAAEHEVAADAPVDAAVAAAAQPAAGSVSSAS